MRRIIIRVPFRNERLPKRISLWRVKWPMTLTLSSWPLSFIFHFLLSVMFFFRVVISKVHERWRHVIVVSKIMFIKHAYRIIVSWSYCVPPYDVIFAWNIGENKINIRNSAHIMMSSVNELVIPLCWVLMRIHLMVKRLRGYRLLYRGDLERSLLSICALYCLHICLLYPTLDLKLANMIMYPFSMIF